MAEHRQPPARLTALAGAVAVLVTLAVIGLPFLRFAYRAPELHVALETTAALTALVLAFLVYGRFRLSGALQELLLSLSLGLVAVVNLLLAGLPPVLGIAGEELLDWGSIGLRLLGTLLLTAAAVTPRRWTVVRPSGVVLGLLGLVVLVGAALTTVGDLPDLVDPALDLSDTGRPLVIGHPALLAAQALGAVAYAVSAVAFTRQAGRRPDELVRWLGAACVLAAFSRVNYFLFPSLYSEYIYTGDLLRFGFYVLLLIGAAREVQSYWAARAQAAVLEDRRRLARDLHDGLTQELSYIWTQSRRLTEVPGDATTVERINGAAARALDEARSAIAALTRTTGAGFDEVLRETTDGLASRYDATVRLSIDPGVPVSPERGDAVLRIVAEAFRNAVLHGHATTVEVDLQAGPVLRVTDDGQGFDLAEQQAGGGFGLISMRERAEALGADFALVSRPGQGTTVEVVWR